MKLVNENAYDVPLKDSLAQLLSNEILFDEVSASPTNIGA